MLRSAILLLVSCIALSSGFSAFQLSDGVEGILSSPLDTEFSCADRSYGYYADVANGCQIFHVCLPIEDDAGAIIQNAQFSFGCGAETVFDQEGLTCIPINEEFDCSAAPSLYDSSNAEFGVIPERR